MVLSASESLELTALLEMAEVRPTLSRFIRRLSPTYSIPPHITLLIKTIERSLREPIRILVSMPPRHGKTETLLHAIPWRLVLEPHKTCGYMTYGIDLALSKSRKARRLALEAGIRLADDSKAVQEWRTRQGGGLLATGVGGSLTGKGIDFAIVDDPIKNRQDAESITMRERVWEEFQSTIFTRLEPGSSCMVVSTRWHIDDLHGRLMAMEGSPWEVINIPAISEDDADPLGRMPGEALWPERYSVEHLDEIRRQVGEYTWASLYQGRPRPRGGELFREPERYGRPDINRARIVIGVDPAASEKTTADYSVACVLAVRGFGAETEADALEVFRAQIEVPKLCAVLMEMHARWSAPLVIEAVGVGKAVPQMLRAIKPELPLIEVDEQRGDKFVRAQPVAAAWNEGRVRVPTAWMDEAGVTHEAPPWVHDFLSELRAFTGVKDRHDDQVDALALAWSYAYVADGVHYETVEERHELAQASREYRGAY